MGSLTQVDFTNGDVVCDWPRLLMQTICRIVLLHPEHKLQAGVRSMATAWARLHYT